MNPKAVGEISEATVLALLVRLGYPVLIPFGNNQRYDFVIEEDGKFVTLQVKTGRLSRGCVVFNSASINGFTGARTAYRDAVDDFVVYCPDTDEVYRVPVAMCGASSVALRVEPTLGGPKSTIRWAKDFVMQPRRPVLAYRPG